MDTTLELTKKELRGLLTKKPFTRVLPNGHYEHGYVLGTVQETPVQHDMITRKIVTQEDFLRELDPSGHLIYDKEMFPDIWRKNEEDGKWYVDEVPRYAFAFQQIILIKHLTHLCGNDIQFELSDKSVTEEKRNIFGAFRDGWANKNMEIAWYYLAKSVKATGDGAFVGFMDNGEFGWKVLSFLNGDRLYPHFSQKTGRLELFARTYNNYSEDGTINNRYIDVWDDKYYYRFVSDGDATSALEKAKRFVFKIFSADGYKIEFMQEHGFDSIPIAYQRDENGPCWTFSEESIENYEIAFSNLAQSNHNFGLPIMYIKGEGSEEVATEDMSYATKIMLLPSDGEIGFLNRQDASNAYKAELDKLEDNIYKQSFAVKTPELKSGDTPGVALKIMYSDAYEKAMNDAQEYDGVVDKMIDIFTWGYGIESERRLSFINTNIRHFIEPYVHRNFTETITNLNTAVIGKFLSRQTASEKNPYAVPNEWQRLLQEEHDTQMHQLLIEDQRLDIQNEHQLDMQEKLMKMQTQQQLTLQAAESSGESPEEKEENTNDRKKRKFSVATGHGTKRGRPNMSGIKWDSNGNYEGRNNWDKWNITH